MDIHSILQTVSIVSIPLVLAITLHEAAHGYMAKKCGDNTAEMMGRLTLNPVKHIDPIGTILIPAVLLFTGAGFLFGYAKPVPVNFNRLRDIKWDSIKVALAGPGVNLFLAILSVLLMNFVPFFPEYIAEPLVQILLFSVQINVILMVFNLLPLLPLDGGRVLHALLPEPFQSKFGQTEPFGMFILLGLMFLGLLFTIIQPLYIFTVNILQNLVFV